MGDEDELLRENLNQGAHEAEDNHNDDNNLRNRFHAVQRNIDHPEAEPRHNLPDNRNSVAQERNSHLVFYQLCSLIGLVWFIISSASIIFLLYQIAQGGERCGYNNAAQPQLISDSSVQRDPSLCERELEKWQKMFNYERNYSSEMINNIITRIEDYTYVESELKVFKTRYYITVSALLATWVGLFCLALTCCYCYCQNLRRMGRYQQQQQLVVQYEDYTN